MIKLNLVICALFMLMFMGCLYYNLEEAGTVLIIATIFMYSAGDLMYEKKGK